MLTAKVFMRKFDKKIFCLDRPIIIIGAPRTGKSMIGDTLQASGEIFDNSEALMIWNHGMKRRNSDVRHSLEANLELREKIVSLCAKSVHRYGKKRYLDNLSYNMLRIPFINKLIPEAKIIHVYRNGEKAIPEILFGWTNHDTIRKAVRRRWREINPKTFPPFLLRFASNYVRTIMGYSRSTWGPITPGMMDFKKSHSLEELVAYQWVSLISIARRDLGKLPDNSWIEVRYEDMISDPENKFEQICEFCEVENPEAVLQHAKKNINPHQLPNHAQNFKIIPKPEKWNLIMEMIKPTQYELGY